MATFNLVNQFYEDLAHGVYDFSAHQLKVVLTAAANPPLVTNTVEANLTQIAYTNLSSRNVTTFASGQTSGVYKLELTDLVLSGTGPVAAFQHIALVNDTPTSPLKPIIGWIDHGSPINIDVGSPHTINFSEVNGALQLALKV